MNQNDFPRSMGGYGEGECERKRSSWMRCGAEVAATRHQRGEIFKKYLEKRSVDIKKKDALIP